MKLKQFHLLNIESLHQNDSFFLFKQLQFNAHSKVDSSFYTFSKSPIVSERDYIYKHLLLGDFHLLKPVAEDSLALDSYKNAVDFAVEIKDTLLIAEGLKKIITQLTQNRKAFTLAKDYLKQYSRYLYDEEEEFIYNFLLYTTIAASDDIEMIQPLKNNLNKYHFSKNMFIKAKHYQMLGVYHSYYNHNIDSALYYMKKAEHILDIYPYQSFKNELIGIYGNIGLYNERRGNHELAHQFYKKANSIIIPKYRYAIKVKLHQLLAENAVNRKRYDSAFFFLKAASQYNDTLNEYDKAKALNDLDKKYKTIEKDKQILISEQQRKQNKNLFYITLICLLCGSVIGFLTLKNSRKKRLIAEQLKALEAQKNLTLLKEQELHTINAMISGQEKERIRIAEDLHDNIGSVLATLKLHFENLKLNREKQHFNQDDLYEKTEKLIDETYLKVRSIAHAKNAGLIANKGLLVAVKLMAEKISDANKLTITVLHYGLSKPLDNDFELTMFRMIQELITNIIKHANAKQITINLSLFDNILNLIVEDDGQGFHDNTNTLHKGMGLHSIKTRLDHLKGTFEIDSTLGKGTSIIINAPLQ